MIPDRYEKIFNEFYDAVRSNDVLDTKTTLLLHLGTSMAVGCGP
jgi:hypothetical protein